MNEKHVTPRDRRSSVVAHLKTPATQFCNRSDLVNNGTFCFFKVFNGGKGYEDGAEGLTWKLFLIAII